MAFNVKFYKIDAPPNKLDKGVVPGTTGTIGTAAGYSCTPFEPVGTLEGSILIDYVALDKIETANYAYISGDNRARYAYVTGFDKEIGGHLKVYLREDPLMTFKTEIEDAPILATRSSVLAKDGGNVGYNAYLQDGMWTCDATELNYTSRDLFNGFFNYDKEDAGFILMTAG